MKNSRKSEPVTSEKIQVNISVSVVIMEKVGSGERT
jgi:hypothetical protein